MSSPENPDPSPNPEQLGFAPTKLRELGAWAMLHFTEAGGKVDVQPNALSEVDASPGNWRDAMVNAATELFENGPTLQTTLVLAAHGMRGALARRRSHRA